MGYYRSELEAGFTSTQARNENPPGGIISGRIDEKTE